ncbi:MAG: C40 family peptidase [Alistipes timonensis]|nr:C40 family peptidase [Alistipes timonensis]
MKRILLIIGALSALLSARGADFAKALPTVSVACMRAEPRHGAEMVSQAIMGTPLRLLEEGRGGWWRVATPEGYEGWIIGNSLAPLDDDAFAAWQRSGRVFISHPDPQFVYADTVATGTLPRVSDLVDGAILSGTPNPCGHFTAVTLPDGRQGFVLTEAATALDAWGARAYDPERMPALAARYMGTPYLWGGTSSKSMDCSGLTKICAYDMGIILPRDASQQAREGTRVIAPTDGTPSDDEIALLHPGDLLFFGNKRTGAVNHVAIYMGDGRFIHASGRVKINSLRPADADYHRATLLHARRLSPTDARRFAAAASDSYFPQR